MFGCVEFESSMTGSTRTGPLKPPVDSAPLNTINKLSSSGQARLDNETTVLQSPGRQEETPMRHKMTPVRPPSGQPIQLTPLWEHVVRTRRFPSEVDTRETFDEITMRLRDPEWEVRQHALRVLVDVLPTLDFTIIDDAMTTVLPELVNNLGHPAPAVRKGALDTLRVYLVCSRNREDIVRGILNEGLIQQDTLDNFQTNLTLGVILSTPSLLFPSSSTSRPSGKILREAIGGLVNRLVQVTHQEASLRSLVKINELLGNEEFDFYLNAFDINAKRDYEILCDVYKIKASEKMSRKKSGKTKKCQSDVSAEPKIDDRVSEGSNENSNKNLQCEHEVSGIEEKDEKSINLLTPPSRIVLETEIKFNEETAITMTIIEQKEEDSEEELIFEDNRELSKKLEEKIGPEDENDAEETNEIKDEWIERRKTPRRVHFGGEIVKLRTPDSDDSELLQTDIIQTRIPIPISPTTKITAIRPRRSRSNPCSPNVVRSRSRKSKSVSNSPKREFYIHDASLSPKKSILTRSSNNSAGTTVRPIEESNKKMSDRVDTLFGRQESDNGWAFEIYDNDDFVDSGNEKIDFTKKSSASVINRESSKQKPRSAKGNNKILTIETNETTGINDESSIDFFPDFTLEKVDQLKKSASPRKKRNSARAKNENAKNNENTNVEKSEIVEIENSENLKKNSSDYIVTWKDEKIASTNNFNVPNDNRELPKRKLSSAKTNSQLTRNNEISKIEANESVKVESVELVKGSRIMLESSGQTPQEKQESDRGTRASGNSCEREQFALPETREVTEKFESTNGNNVKSLSMDLPHRTSPRSPKKLVFETFPRKERNYILMELSSPVKTNSRGSNESHENETIDDKNNVELIMNENSSLSRDNSPMGSSVNHLFVDRNEAKNQKIDNHKFSNNLTVRNAISGKSDDLKEKKSDEKKVAPEEIANVKKNESFDVEENHLNDIVITETTKFRESNWEELGLVDQEVLNDLHNKEDWRARVRGLERVASALRTSSALIAIESRLGSLLQAVLGGERSCRVAAAGMAVARVVVAGVSEEALKRRLPQVAWGLARQGGPNAAQLARVAMLRLRPSLLLEQLLQPHCIKARNAKTRENALQLLIFSLVTFPSTEFKVENVAYKVATMVGDRRRRVRQAALDTLAVLAQIYEPEEVTKAGKLAAKGQQDGDSMVAAIRARLARKSLPMVSADGLVLYGLQISPTVQITTGPDVDWIVAGSGSVSPGTGRTRGQIIATTTRQGVQEKNAKNASTKNASSSNGPNFVALGVGLETKNEQKTPLAWQLVQHSAQNESNRGQDKWSADNRDEKFGVKKLETKSRLTGTLRQYRSASDRLDDSFDSNDGNPVFILDDKDVIMKQRKTEENFHRRMDEIYADRTGIAPISQEVAGNRLESRIPVAQSRDRETSVKDTRIGGSSYPRRRLPQEGNNLENWSASSRVSDISRPQSTQREADDLADIKSQRFQRLTGDSSPHRLSPTRDSYRSIYRQGRGFADGNVYREVQTAPTTTSYDVTRRRQSLKDSMAVRIITDSRRIISCEPKTTMNDETRTRRLNDDLVGFGNSTFQRGDKSPVEEEEYNEINKRHFSVQANSYKIQNSSDRSSQCPARGNNGPSESSSNASSNLSVDDSRLEILEKIQDDSNYEMESFVTENNDDVVVATAASPIVEKSFDVITLETNPSRRNSIDYGISAQNVRSSTPESDKDSSIEETSIIPRLHSSHENFVDNRDYENDSSELEETSNDNERNVVISYVTNESNSSDGSVSKASDDSPVSNESQEEMNIENLKLTTSPARVDALYAIRSIDPVEFANSSPSTDENDGPEATTMSYVREYPQDLQLKSVPRAISPRVDIGTPVRTEMFVQRTNERAESRDREENIISIVVASRPQSRDSREHEDEEFFQALDFRQSQSPIESPIVTKILECVDTDPLSIKLEETTSKSTSLNDIRLENATIVPTFSRVPTNLEKIDRTSNAGNENATTLTEVNGTQASTSERNEPQKRIAASRVPRMRQKNRVNIARVAPMQPSTQTNDRNTSKSKTIIQQCFTQLESNDWEVTTKGLKGLSQIARQQPEQLDSCAPGTIGRLLGRHVRNLRSQVSRAACLAAGDVFGTQARCIDQDLDDIAGPLLHRTADTNKFLRADSNEALDRMVEHLPPNKTIVVIVHRGATHQNPIVRATTARLLATIVDRFGPEWTMSLPRDVREKLIATGAKLLMDGNLDARNHAKRMFREWSRCEVFRKVLKDSVPETTLRHIDKTLKSL